MFLKSTIRIIFHLKLIGSSDDVTLIFRFSLIGLYNPSSLKIEVLGILGKFTLRGCTIRSWYEC